MEMIVNRAYITATLASFINMISRAQLENTDQGIGSHQRER